VLEIDIKNFSELLDVDQEGSQDESLKSEPWKQ
jgi:hypothetical protein